MKINPRLKEDLKKYLLRKQEEEQNKVMIRSAYKLSEEELKSITEFFPELKGKEIVEVTDDSLLAGVVIQQGSKVRDLSLKSQLMSLEQRINEIA